METRGRPKLVAFYLPQFHPIPENDQWWGEGFTEWTNVRRSLPSFVGHRQPVTPDGPYGEYSLLDPDVVKWQTELATANGIDAFCYYHYWFAGKRLLEKPLNNYIQSDLEMPFCICWANENWSRRWDGKSHEVLIAQAYDDTTPDESFKSFMPYLRDHRYLRVDGRAVLLVHRVEQLPHPHKFAARWRELAREEGFGELWLVASETSYDLDPRVHGFDAVAEFPPVGDSNLKTAARRPPGQLRKQFRGRLLSYDRLAQSYIDRSPVPFPRHRGLIPRWDNTARRGLSGTVFLGGGPAAYARWLEVARQNEAAERGRNGIVFINAWNEWAEGAYLEQDTLFGELYLEATRTGIANFAEEPDCDYHSSDRRWLNFAFLHSLALESASSAKNRLVKWRRRVTR